MQIANLDKSVSGEDRLINLERHLAGSFIYRQSGVVEGFYLPTFGEGRVIAKTNFAGHERMKLRLTTRENVAFPMDNFSAIEFMYQNNFKEFRSAKRMRLGTKRTWQPERVYNRIGGNLGYFF